MSNQTTIIAFLKKAKVRGGDCTFKAETFQKDAMGNISMIKGTITEVIDDKEQTSDMYWNINGTAVVTSVPYKYDLIEDEIIDFGGETQTAEGGGN